MTPGSIFYRGPRFWLQPHRGLEFRFLFSEERPPRGLSRGREICQISGQC
jgi:hypothetical protein